MTAFKIAGFPLPFYLAILVLLYACMYIGCVPNGMVGGFLLLMVIGEGLNTLGKTLPVVKTYLGGSVACILGGAVIGSLGLIPQGAVQTADAFVNEQGFLVFYIAALICGSLFSIDRDLLLRATVKILPTAVIGLAAGCTVVGLLSLLMGYSFLEGILMIAIPMTSGGMTPLYFITVVAGVLAITLTAAFIGGKLMGFYPLEAAIAAGMCTTNMGGSGNVAVLSSAERMELLPFAQIVTRSCGALMLTLGGILIQLLR